MIKVLNDKKNTGVLFRHEICFVLGCLGDKAKCVIDGIIKTAEDITENGIVRHEAVSAYSSISDNKDVLKKFLDDPADIVRESCLVGLELIDYWHEWLFVYILTLKNSKFLFFFWFGLIWFIRAFFILYFLNTQIFSLHLIYLLFLVFRYNPFFFWSIKDFIFIIHHIFSF